MYEGCVVVVASALSQEPPQPPVNLADWVSKVLMGVTRWCLTWSCQQSAILGVHLPSDCTALHCTALHCKDTWTSNRKPFAKRPLQLSIWGLSRSGGQVRQLSECSDLVTNHFLYRHHSVQALNTLESGAWCPQANLARPWQGVRSSPSRLDLEPSF
jgi:hypothetical protein